MKHSSFLFFRAFTVCSLILFVPLRYHSPFRMQYSHRAFTYTPRSFFAHRSESAHHALAVLSKCVTLRSPFVECSLIVHFVFIQFHLDLKSERIGLCESQQNEKRRQGRRLIFHIKIFILILI